jgi:hypothetical protein
LSDSTGGGNNGANEFVRVDQFDLDRQYAVEQIPIKAWLVHLARFSQGSQTGETGLAR